MTRRNLRQQMRELKEAMWDTESPRGFSVKLRGVENFGARGMKRVYGRCDEFGRGASFNLDVWLSRDGQLFARFWSRCGDINNYSFEVLGVPREIISTETLDESWVPDALRDEYVEWTVSGG